MIDLLSAIEALEAYEPSPEMVKCFNEEAKGFSHKLTFDPHRGMLFFSALTEVGIIQIYADSLEEIERQFIQEVRERLRKEKHPIRPGWMQDDGWGE